MNTNICKFMPKNESINRINVLNFVYETQKQVYNGFKCETVYKMHLVIKGRGKLHIPGKIYDLGEGDLFFLFPSMSYALESQEEFEYMYISYIGEYSNMLMDKLNINKERFLFKNIKKLKNVWTESITDDESIMSLRCEGILIYSFSIVGEQIMNERENKNDTLPLIKKYVDENFTDAALSLQQISSKYPYNTKYISSAFKKKYKAGLNQYITTLRIQHACTLIEQGFTSVKNIASLCGYSEPLYFSKVFKDRIGVSPTEHIKNISRKQ